MTEKWIEDFIGDRKYFAAAGLDRKLAKYLDYDAGYYVELGANDGFNQSNTLYLERTRSWRGVLVEAVAKNYRKCLAARHDENKVYNAACVSFAYAKPSVKLRYSNLMTTPIGLESDIADPISHADSGAQYLRKSDSLGDIVAPARTLNSLLDDAKAPATIDFLSLDVEGAELEVLKGIDHTKYRFKKILVECRSIDSMDRYMATNDYRLITNLTHHDFLFESIRQPD